MEKDIIDEEGELKATYLGRERSNKRITCSKSNKDGEVLAVGEEGGRRWLRENKEEYEIDLTIDSGAVTTIAPANTVPGQRPRETEASPRGVEYRIAKIH